MVDGSVGRFVYGKTVGALVVSQSMGIQRWVGGSVVSRRSVSGKTVYESVVGGGFLMVVGSLVIGLKLKNPQ